MLAVFEKSIASPSEELRFPTMGSENSISKEQIFNSFKYSFNFGNGNFMAFSPDDNSYSKPWSLAGIQDVFCFFIGTLRNLDVLRSKYGLQKNVSESMFVSEAYQFLRDRAPSPPQKIIRDFKGHFAFVLFDQNSHTIFVARDSNGGVDLQWGLASDGSLVFSSDSNMIKEACGKSCATFPSGCLFKTGNGLMSFDYPLYKVRGKAQKDGAGNIYGVVFEVNFPTIPRTGSASNSTDATVTDVVTEEDKTQPDKDVDAEEDESQPDEYIDTEEDESQLNEDVEMEEDEDEA
ncbi:hypothetical protein UlMin_017130 [Ulmus minor]